MNTAAESEHQARDVLAALRFFWSWLLVSALVSLAGNATHAVVTTTKFHVVAALMAMVPPLILLAATHGVALLARLRHGSSILVPAAILTLGLAVLAFVLSFDALKALAVTTGTNADLAWMWPAVVDGGITLATLAIFGLSYSSAAREARVEEAATHYGVAESSRTPAPIEEIAPAVVGPRSEVTKSPVPEPLEPHVQVPSPVGSDQPDPGLIRLSRRRRHHLVGASP